MTSCMKDERFLLEFSQSFPRLYDVYVNSDRGRSDNYFEHPNCKLAVMRREEKLLEIESRLQSIDSMDWHAFKTRAARLTTVQDEWRWNTQLFDCFNEAQGYCFLKEQGCSDVHFIGKQGSRTPDLIAKCPGGTVLAEVKTIHESDEENDHLTRRIRINNGDETDEEQTMASEAQAVINDKLRDKLQRTIDSAGKQLRYPAEDVQRRFILLYIHLDLPYSTNRAIKDLDGFVAGLQPSGIEIRHWVKNGIIL